MKRVIIANDIPDHLDSICTAINDVCGRHNETVSVLRIDDKDVPAAATRLTTALANLDQPPYDLVVLDILYPKDVHGGIHLWGLVPNECKGRSGVLLVVSNSDDPCIGTFVKANNGFLTALAPNRLLKQMIGKALGFPPTNYST
jgi:hypothetical protein